jgi:lycopene beta-cyclase|tara:strand:- start:56571 stop:57764 length:1194 start_codon:yes stop_codon:yes gene_type:complete
VRDFDIILAGGGLAAGLIAMRLADVRPGISVAIIDGGERIGGDHIWSRFDSDLRGPQLKWTQELYAHRWQDGYDVRFPAYSRTLSTPYASVRSERLDAAVRARLPAEAIITGRRIDAVTPTLVRMDGGDVLQAGAVIDCRGQRSSPHLKLAWQKFVGLELETARPHGITRPVIMDARVDQLDGYRFVYVLPFSETGLLVEDTYYSDGPDLSEQQVLARVRDYVAGMGLGDVTEGRTESGVLPIALDGDIEAYWAEDDVPKAGMAAALFNPITGYSFADAVATADMVKSLSRVDAAPLYRSLRDHSVSTWKERGFYRLLNRMMFEAATPQGRYRTLQHFYRMDEDLVERFYAAQSTAADKARILSGKPPVSLPKAVGVLSRSIPKISWRPRWRAREEE